MGVDKEPSALPERAGTDQFALNLLLSARAAKFFKIKSPQLVKLKEWGKPWGDPDQHWFSNWRCEECFPMEGTEERVFIVTNEASRFSILLRLAPGDIKGLLTRFHGKMMKSLKKHGLGHPSKIQLHVATLSGAAPSLTSCQNNLMYYLDTMVERRDFKYLDDLEPRLNLYLTTIRGNYDFPADEFARLCAEAPPYVEQHEPNKIPFLN